MSSINSEINIINTAKTNLADALVSKFGMDSSDFYTDGVMKRLTDWVTLVSGATVATTNALTFSDAGSGAASGSTFDGSTAITLSYNSIGAAAADHTHSDYITSSGSITGNAGTATKLKTARTLWGKSFNGTANITGNMTNVGNISFSETGKNIGGFVYFDTTNSQLGIGNSTPAYALDVSGGIHCTTGGYSDSDIRFKNVQENLKIAPNDIADLPIFKYTWKNKADDILHVGSSALAVEKILPELVIDNGTKALDYATLGTVGSIIACKKIVELEEKIKELEEKINGLQTRD